MSHDSKREETGSTDETSWSEAPWLFLKGCLVGTADVIPGVSGGTMALITGIYDRLIHAMSSLNRESFLSLLTLRFGRFFRTFHWRFLLILLGGVVGAIAFFTRVIPLQIYMHTDPELVFGLFFGLILGSVVLLIREIGPERKRWDARTALLGGTLFGLWIVNLVPANTPEHFLFVFLSGMIAFSAMILPGISGSYILLILGKYDYILGNVAGIGGPDTVASITALLPLLLGGITGLVLFSRILSWLLKHYHTVTLMVMIGIMIGSLSAIWPWQERTYRQEVSLVEMRPLTDPLVIGLQQGTARSSPLSWYRLGDREEESGTIEVERIERKLVKSDPYIPGINQPEGWEPGLLHHGMAGMVIGLILVGGLEFLRRKSST